MITLDYIKSELKKTAFFVQYSGLFDKFPTRMRNTLDSLPVEWEKVDVGGEFKPSWTKNETEWKEADLLGKLNKEEFKLKIIRDEDRYEYRIYFQKKLYKINNLDKLKSTINSIFKGEKPKPQLMQEFYDALFANKSEIHKYAEMHFLAQLTPFWSIDIKRDLGHIYIRFFVVDEEVLKNRRVIEGKLFEHNAFRIESIIHYLKTIAKKITLDIDKLEFKHRPIDMPHQLGFLISIK